MPRPTLDGIRVLEVGNVVRLNRGKPIWKGE
jgi:hypothetical protein